MTTKTHATRSKPKSAAKSKAPKKAAKAKSLPANPMEDKALKQRYLEALDRLRNASASEAKGWDERYEALGDILESEPPYYLAGGYKTQVPSRFR